jgi:hypothetical protein
LHALFDGNTAGWRLVIKSVFKSDDLGVLFQTMVDYNLARRGDSTVESLAQLMSPQPNVRARSMPVTSSTLASFVNGFVHPSELKRVKYSRKKDDQTMARKDLLEGVLNEIVGGGDEAIEWSKQSLSKHSGILWRTLFPRISELEQEHPNLECMLSGTSDGFGIHILFADKRRLSRVAPAKKSVADLAGKREAKASAENPECTDGLRSISSFKGIIQLDQSFKDGNLAHGEEELENLMDHPVICGDLGMLYSLIFCRQDCGVDCYCFGAPIGQGQAG